MSEFPQAHGVAFFCDGDGWVTELVHDGVGLTRPLEPGASLADVVDAASASKAEAFLAALRERGSAFNWELNVRTDGARIGTMHFVGAAVGDGFLVIAGRSRSGVSSLCEEIALINSEQATLLRQALKDLSLQTRDQSERETHHFEGLSRLNNDLATMQRQLAKSNAELARLNEQKNQFLGIAAHDLRNPLEVILSYSHFLLEDAPGRLDDEQETFVREIRSSSEFMLRLVDNLLDVSKIEAGRLDLDLEQVDLAGLLEANVARNRLLAERKDVAVDLSIDGCLPVMRVDRAKVEQVVNNLVGNAVKFSPPGSAVAVSASATGDRATISVRDSGPGVPASEVERIFRPFERSVNRPTGSEKSTGLGLAIVKRIVEGHGGTISVSSEPSGGATFEVTLPVAPSHTK